MLWWICLMVGHGCFGQKAVISCLHCNLRDCVLVIYLFSFAFEWQVRHPKTWHLFAEGGLILRIRHLGISTYGSAHDSYMLVYLEGRMKTDICSLAHILRTMCQWLHLQRTIESTNTLICVHHCRLHLFIDWVFPQVLRSGDVITWPDLFSCIPIFTGLLAVGCHGLHVSACQLDNNSWWSCGG